jgi:hypothetical protein
MSLLVHPYILYGILYPTNGIRVHLTIVPPPIGTRLRSTLHDTASYVYVGYRVRVSTALDPDSGYCLSITAAYLFDNFPSYVNPSHLIGMGELIEPNLGLLAPECFIGPTGEAEVLGLIISHG